MISVFGSCLGQEEITASGEVIRSQWLGMGPQTELFEKEMQHYLGAENFLLVNSGSSALQLAVRLLDLPPGSEIILPSFTWVSCAHAIVLSGHKPVFCDVDTVTQNTNAKYIREKISGKTGAVLLVHYAGKPVDVFPILELGFPVIEDAAHAVCSKKNGKSCGTIGDIGIYSFDSVKNLACGEAGGIVCKKPEHAAKAKKLRYAGIGKSGFQSLISDKEKNWWEHSITEAFPKMLPSDLNAAIGLAQLKKLPHHQESRKNQWKKYQKAFRSHQAIICPAEPEKNEIHSYFTYLIQVSNRNELARKLLERGIYTTLRYHPLHLSDFYNTGISLPNSETLSGNGLNIPLHPRLTEADQDNVIETILECAAR